MCVTAAAAIVSGGASIAGSIFGYNEAKKQALQQQLYNLQAETQEEKYRAELTRYQGVVYKQEIKYGHQVLDWQKSEFARQGEMVEKAQANVNKNLLNNYATLLQRQVEEHMAAAFDIENTERQARKLRASAQVTADARGVEGNSVESVINDVSRQAGEATHILELNRSATMRQLNLEMMGLKASADQALYNIPIQTYGPREPLHPPQPISPTKPAAPVAMPSRSALMVNVVGGVLQGMQNYASWSGQTMRQAFRL